MRAKIFRIVNKTIQIFYYGFIVVPVLFVVVSLYSYFHVKNAIGEEPTSEDIVYPVVVSKHITLHLLPHDVGKFVIGLYACSILFFFVLILSNLILRLRFKSIQLHFGLALTSALTNIFSVILLYTYPPTNWYFSFILD